MATSITGRLVVTGCILATPALAFAQQPLNWAADDGKRVAVLAKDGSRIDGQNVIIWFPPTLSRADAEALLKRIDPAVAGLWHRVGIHDWQLVPKGKITYYLVDDAFVAHASGRSAVFVPMARVRDGRAPFLHEATHELLASRRNEPSSARGSATPVVRPLWLTEGLPDYIARLVAQESGITEEGPFGTPTLDGVDATCAERARTADGAAMLPFVGGAGRPEVLFTTDRQRFAPTFYACAFSFTKYLAGQAGLDALVGLFALTPTETASQIDRLAGAPLADLRAQWLRQLNVP
jgi:hypothetical protein